MVPPEAGRAMTDEPRARGLFAISVVLSAIGVALLGWWVFGDTRRPWVLGAGALAAIAGVVLAARARREPVEPPPEP